MMDFCKIVGSIVWKDILLESRTKDISLSIIIFASLVLLIFNFAVEPTTQIMAIVAPGIMWVAITFAGVLGLTRSLALEKESGNLHALMTSPISRESIFYGKMLSNFLFMFFTVVIVFPIFTVLFNLSTFSINLYLIAILTIIGTSCAGTLFATMAINTRSREIMLPLLFLPIIVPIVIAAVEATGPLITNTNTGSQYQWIYLLGVMDLILLVICPLGFSIIIEE